MDFYFLDTETTGIDATASVCEVAFTIADENFNILSQHQSIIDPEQMISPAASGVHGLVWDDCKAFPTIAEYFSADDPSCYGKKLSSPSVVIGHRCGFDMRFIGPYFESAPLQIDTLRWVRKLYPDMDNHQLSTCIFALNLPRSAGAHRAMADVMSAYYLCQHICERTGLTLEQLAEASTQPMELAIYPFGKHKGEPFSSVPKSYLRWAKENMKDLDIDMSYTINLLLK
jgi:exodeoxyribonuclease X